MCIRDSHNPFSMRLGGIVGLCEQRSRQRPNKELQGRGSKTPVKIIISDKTR